MILRFSLPVALLATLAAGCSGSPQAPQGGGVAAGPMAGAVSPEVVELFKTRCALCHGESGKGDGVAAAPLNPKPRDYTDGAWQKSVTDEYLRDIIVGGGAKLGKSPLMPPNPDLADKPALVDGLVKKVRSFAH